MFVVLAVILRVTITALYAVVGYYFLPGLVNRIAKVPRWYYPLWTTGLVALVVLDVYLVVVAPHSTEATVTAILTPVPYIISGIVIILITRHYLRHAVVRTKEEEEAQRLEALGRMARGILHDWNHVIGAVKLYTGFIEEHVESLPPEREQRRSYDGLREDVRAIGQAMNHAEELSRHLQDFVREGNAQATVLDLNEAVTTLTDLLRFPTVTVRLKLNDGPLWIEASKTALRQVLMNLALNARDAMPEGGALMIHTDFENGNATLRVVDTGHGMSEDTREHIFEPWFTTKSQGTGLGLSTVHGIVKRYNGDIDVVSAPGAGTDITITFPTVTPRRDYATPRPRP